MADGYIRPRPASYAQLQERVWAICDFAILFGRLITGSADDIRRLNRLLDSEPWNILSVQSEP